MGSTWRPTEKHSRTCYSSDIVRYDNARCGKRLQSALALAVAFSLLLIGAKAMSTWPDPHDDHAPHSIVTSFADEIVVVTEHPHLQEDHAAMSPDISATAVVPRIAKTLAVLGLAIATAFLGMYAGHRVGTTIRAPPLGLVGASSGRHLLAQLCIARR